MKPQLSGPGLDASQPAATAASNAHPRAGILWDSRGDSRQQGWAPGRAGTWVDVALQAGVVLGLAGLAAAGLKALSSQWTTPGAGHQAGTGTGHQGGRVLPTAGMAVHR